MKKSEILILIAAVLLVMPLASAGIFDFLFTGKSTTQPTEVNADVGNTVPQIIWVEPIADVQPSEEANTTVTFKFTAYDHDSNLASVNDISDSSAWANFTKGGEATRSVEVACTAEDAQITDKTKNYTCSIDMWYWDKAGIDWNINTHICDTSGACAENVSTTFKYDSLLAFKMSPNALNWTNLIPGDNDTGASNDPTILNNTGNADPSKIQINATELLGNIDVTKTIRAENFSANIVDSAGGTPLVTSINETIASATLLHGNLSIGGGIAQRNLYYYLYVPSTVTKQTYTTLINGAWEVKVLE